MCSWIDIGISLANAGTILIGICGGIGGSCGGCGIGCGVTVKHKLIIVSEYPNFCIDFKSKDSCQLVFNIEVNVR